jgi:TPR repeat protein
MARFEIADGEGTALDVHAGSDVFFNLGMMYATGGSVPADLVTAHKWFNIAALKGNAEAARLRRELSAEMSDGDIAAAQRAARAWLNTADHRIEHRAAA